MKLSRRDYALIWLAAAVALAVFYYFKGTDAFVITLEVLITLGLFAAFVKWLRTPKPAKKKGKKK